MTNDIDAVRKKVGDVVMKLAPNCPICKGDQWETGKLSRSEFERANQNIGGPPPPPKEYEKIVCATCGYVHEFKIEPLLALNLEGITPR